MSISHDDVNYVARLARLKMDPDELDRYAAQLSGILEHIGKISQLDLAEVAPTSHVLKLSNVFRDDVVAPSLPLEKVLSNGPEVEDGAFRVPQILEAEETDV